MKKINVKDMGKKFLVGLGLSAFILGIGGATYADSLKERQAKEIAIKTAEINSTEVQYIKVKLEQEDDYKIIKGKKIQYVYEVEFLHNGFEYDFDIDAETKEVLKSKVEPWND